MSLASRYLCPAQAARACRIAGLSSRFIHSSTPARDSHPPSQRGPYNPGRGRNEGAGRNLRSRFTDTPRRRRDTRPAPSIEHRADTASSTNPSGPAEPADSATSETAEQAQNRKSRLPALASFLTQSESFSGDESFKFDKVINQLFADPKFNPFLAALKRWGLDVRDGWDGLRFLHYAQTVRQLDHGRMNTLVELCARVGNSDCVILQAARLLTTSAAPRRTRDALIAELDRTAHEQPVALLLLGALHARSGDLDAAESMIAVAIEALEPDDMPALAFLRISPWTTLGTVLRCLGPERADEATAAFRRGVTEDADPVAMYALARAIADFEQPAGAAAADEEPRYPTHDCTREWFELTLEAASAGELKSAFSLGVFYCEARPEMFAALEAGAGAGPDPLLARLGLTAATGGDGDEEVSMRSILAEPARFGTVAERIRGATAVGPPGQRRQGWQEWAAGAAGEAWLLEAAWAGYVPAALYLARRIDAKKNSRPSNKMLTQVKYELQNVGALEREYYKAEFDKVVHMLYPET